MLLEADNQLPTVQKSCNNESKSFLNLGKPEKIILTVLDIVGLIGKH